MAYGSLLADTVQGSTASTPPVFKDGNGTQIGTLCRAWVNFNGTGTVAIRASFNVSSITDNGTGSYTVNFTNAMPDTNYAVHGSTAKSTALVYVLGAKPSTSSAALVYTNDSSGGVLYSNSYGDHDFVSVSVFR